MLDKDQVIESVKNFISKKNCVFLSNSLPKPNGINQKSKKITFLPTISEIAITSFYLRRKHLASLQRNNRIPT